MKQSIFNIIVAPGNSTQQQRVVLYNTFHDHRLVIEGSIENIARFFDKTENGLVLTNEERESAQLFYNLGILLDDNACERHLFDDWYNKKIQNARGLLNLVLVTTMACNLRCPYCYEKGVLNARNKMTPQTAGLFVDWVVRQIGERRAEQVEVIYFGGEPLMNRNVLLETSSRLKRLCAERGLAYHGRMISNGVLMTPETARALRQAGIDKIKITLDGDAADHDRTRITASGRGSFEKIWHNLTHANDDLKDGEQPLRFMIGGNFHESCFAGFFGLLNRLAEAPFREYVDEISFKPVQDISVSPQKELSSSPCDKVCYNAANIGRMVSLRAEIIKKGLTPTDGLNLGPCDFYRGDSLTVGTNGAIYPCGGFVDNAEFAIGHICDNLTTQTHRDRQKKWKGTRSWSDNCYQCSFLPVCTGGCRVKAHSQGFDLNSPVCEKAYFQAIAQAMSRELANLNTSTQVKENIEGLANMDTVAKNNVTRQQEDPDFTDPARFDGVIDQQ